MVLSRNLLHHGFLSITTGCLLFAAGAPASASAQTSARPDQPPAVTPADSLAAGPGAQVPPRLTALAREVGELQETFTARLAELNARFAAATNQTAAAALQQEIATLKLDLELQMLQAQLRETGRRDPAEVADFVAELEQAVAAARARRDADAADPQQVPAAATRGDR
jgi:hypothetical protein